MLTMSTHLIIVTKKNKRGECTRGKECKADKHVTNAVEDDYVEEQSKSDQVDELDDRDRRRLERINRAQPRILPISTLFGVVWNKQLHYAAQRVEDNMLHRMEKGAGGHDVVQIGYSQQ
jgi:hypothetical protein